MQQLLNILVDLGRQLKFPDTIVAATLRPLGRQDGGGAGEEADLNAAVKGDAGQRLTFSELSLCLVLF